MWNVISERMTTDEIRGCTLLNSQGSDTDFSGHGCWELAADMISQGLRKRGLLVDLRPKSACAPWLVVHELNTPRICFQLHYPESTQSEDVDLHCQSYLLNRLPLQTCIFGDIMDVFGDGKAWTDLLQRQATYWEKKRALYDRAQVYDSGFCLRHLGYCPYNTGALLRVGGPPCVDFRTAGLRRGEDGPTAGTHIAYGMKAETTSTAMVCFENVQGCPQWLR